jgi:hypothetical protein
MWKPAVTFLVVFALLAGLRLATAGRVKSQDVV